MSRQSWGIRMLRADAGTLAAALQRAVPVTEYWNTIPILSCARLRTEAGVLTISTSNLDQQIDAEATVDLVGPSAAAAIGARRMLAILSRLSKREAVELVIEHERAILNWSGGRAALPTLPAGDFPEMDLSAGDYAEGQLDGQVRASLARVAPFISTEATRYYLNGVCLWNGPEGSRLVATDSRRLASIPGGESLDAIMAQMGNRKPIVPRDAVGHWLNLSAKTDLRMRLRHDAVRMSLHGDGVCLRTKLIDGDYPPWQRVVPDKRKLRALTVPRVALLSALSLLKASLPPKTVNGLIVVENGRLQLQSGGWGGEDIAVDVGPVPGAPFEIGVDPRQLAKSVAATRGATVTLWVSEAGSPLLIEGSETQPNEAVVLMPLRSANRPSFSAPALAEAA